jgi:hypothetical protein
VLLLPPVPAPPLLLLLADALPLLEVLVPLDVLAVLPAPEHAAVTTMAATAASLKLNLRICV